MSIPPLGEELQLTIARIEGGYGVSERSDRIYIDADCKVGDVVWVEIVKESGNDVVGEPLDDYNKSDKIARQRTSDIDLRGDKNDLL